MSLVLHRLRRQRGAMAALVFLAVLVLTAVFAGVLAPHDPLAADLSAVLHGPSGAHWLGTDELGRDVLSRLLYGARVSLVAAVQATAVGAVLGVPPGFVAGYFGGIVDHIISWVADAALSFPPLILAIAIVGVLGPGLTHAMIAIGIVFSPRFLRLVRGSVLGVRQETFVEASRSIGASNWRIIRRHVLPNVASPLIIQLALAAGFAMLSEAGLSFLGLGVQPPKASWGSMLGQAFRTVAREPLQGVWPGLAIVATVLSFNVLGNGLRVSIGRNRSEQQ